MKKNRFLFLLKPFFKYGKGYFLIMLILPVICNAVSILVSVSMDKQIIDSIIAGNGFVYTIKTALFWEALFVGVFIADSFITLNLQNVNYYKITSKITEDIYDKALHTDVANTDLPGFYDSYSYTVREYPGLSHAALTTLSQICVSVVGVATVFSAVSYLSWFAVLLTALYALTTIPLDRKTSELSAERREQMNSASRRLGYIQKLFYQKEYLFPFRITDFRRHVLRDFHETYEKITSIQKEKNLKLCLITVFQTVYARAITLVIMGIYIHLIISGKLSIGSFVAVMSATKILRSIFHNFAGHYRKIRELCLSTNKMYDFFNVTPTIEKPGGKSLVSAASGDFELKLSQVSFHYPNSDRGVKSIDLCIKSGQKTAIVGKNGSGKSTLVKLLLRLYAPDSGSITLNNIPIEEYDISNYRNSVGVALQDSHIFAFSVRDNLTRYCDVADSEMLNALEKLDLKNVCEISRGDLNRQLTREFYADGIELSGGEKQKIAIASVLVGIFDLLIFDEPTSQLDPISEYNLNSLILSESNKNATVIISHRLSLVKNADLILVMNDGEIVERGTHADLMQKGGLYREMYEKQAREYT